MKFKILILCLFAGISAAAQTATPSFTAPVTYFSTLPTGTPSTKGSRFAIDNSTNRIYQWQPVTLSWKFLPYGIEEITGCVAPAYTPGAFDSPFAVNKCDTSRLYYYHTGAWHIVGDGAGGSGGGGSGTVIQFNFTDFNGFDGTVTNATTTPTLSLATTVTGILQGSGGALSAVTVGSGLTFGSGTLAAVDVSATNEIQTLSYSTPTVSLSNGGGSADLSDLNETVSGGTGITVNNVGQNYEIVNNAPDQTVTITGATGTYPNFALPLVAVSEGYGVDISGTTTRTITVDTAQIATLYDVTQATQTVSAGTGISVSQLGQNYTVTNTGDLSTTNEIQELQTAGTADVNLQITGGGGSGVETTLTNVLIPSNGSSGNVLTKGSGTNYNWAAPADGSATNELNTAFTVTGGNLRITDPGGNLDVSVTDIAPVQAVAAGTGISISGTSTRTVTNIAPDQTVVLTEGGIVDITGTYPNFTISATEVDALITNEGIIGVGAGGGNSATIISNTSTATGATVAGLSGILITESTSSNGGTVNVQADTSVLATLYDVSQANQTVSAGAGITVNQTGQNFQVVNNAPDQTVTITGATGTYPTFALPLVAVSEGFGIDITGTTTRTVLVDTSAVATPYDISLKIDKTQNFGGDVSGTYDNLQLGTGVVGPTELAATAVTAGTYGSATQVAQITVDADGRLTSAANVTITGDGWGTQVVEHGSTLTGNGTTGSPLDVATDGITSTQIAADAVGQSEIAAGAVGSSELQSTAVTPGSYTLTNITVDADGRITAAANGTEVDGSTTNELQTIANTSDATSHTATISNSGGSVKLIEGTGIGLATGGTSLDGTVTVTNTAPDQTVTVTPGTGIGVTGAYPNFTVTNSAPDQTVVLTDGGIVDITGTYPNFTISATEADGSTTNELNTAFQVSGGELEITDPGGTIGVPVEDIAPVQDLTAGTGITISGATNKTITANISTGVSGGQSAIGGTGSGENLTLSSTSNATKGGIRFGTASVFNEANNRLGINTTSPSATLHLLQQSIASVGSGSGAAATTLFTMTGTAGGATSAGSGTVFGGNGGGGTITGGAGGAITGTPGTGFGGAGGSFVFTGGNGGTGSTFGGTGGFVEIAGGAGGFGPTAGSSGYASIKGGNAATSSNGAGGNVFVVPGIGDGSGPDGAIYLGLSPSFTQRGNVKIGGSSSPDELLSLGETGTLRGIASFAGETSGKVIIQPAAAAGSWTMTLPTTDGNAGQVLQTDGSGVTGWVDDDDVPDLTQFQIGFGEKTTNVLTSDTALIWQSDSLRMGINWTDPTAELTLKGSVNGIPEGTVIALNGTVYCDCFTLGDWEVDFDEDAWTITGASTDDLTFTTGVPSLGTYDIGGFVFFSGGATIEITVGTSTYTVSTTGEFIIPDVDFTGATEITVHSTGGFVLLYALVVGYEVVDTYSVPVMHVIDRSTALPYDQFGLVVSNTNLSLSNTLQLTSGGRNIAAGREALKSLLTGADNVALGDSAAIAIITTGENTVIGSKALKSGTAVSGTVAVGYKAGENSTASFNILMGNSAGKGLTGGSNVYIGSSAASSATSTTGNIGIGTFSMLNKSGGNGNIGIGINTLAGLAGGTNNSSNNIAIGANSGQNLSQSSNNVLIGDNTGRALTTGFTNTIIGGGAGWNITTGYTNIFHGQQAGYSVTTGYDNTYIGREAGWTCAACYQNVFMGNGAGRNNSASTHDNVGIGTNAGYSNSGSTNVFLGPNAGYSNTLSNSLWIENSNSTTPLIGADFANDRVAINTSLTSASNITSTLHVTGTNGYNQFRLATSYTPTSTADSNGNTGDVAWDADYIYIKTGTGWKRTALSTF